ncbi:hypothetical protein BS47DRAFT_136089 [Hydnum rufescens UP504]|uniref:Uncharacterized protein n=1 Tax=Hydnum rufescens UP504 TaxID=1448309 RepID=A0A9P6AQB7_9AGAM|nr:hypothetical protein BS47DRAFT_136089 [Hydnum rufescens UP504]
MSPKECRDRILQQATDRSWFLTKWRNSSVSDIGLRYHPQDAFPPTFPINQLRYSTDQGMSFAQDPVQRNPVRPVTGELEHPWRTMSTAPLSLSLCDWRKNRVATYDVQYLSAGDSNRLGGQQRRVGTIPKNFKKTEGLGF